MKTSFTISLPVASFEYLFENEQVTRRTIEQTFQDLRTDVADNQDMRGKPVSLATRRFQFLLMGASNG